LPVVYGLSENRYRGVNGLNLKEYLQNLPDYANAVIESLGKQEVLIQLGVIAVLFGLAWFLSTLVEPKLEERARKIKGRRALLRVVVAFLRRLKWLFLSGLLAATYHVSAYIEWPANNYLIFAAMLLALSWLVINVFSHAIHNRLIGRIFAVVVWTLTALTILGITDDVTQVLDNIGFNLGNVRISVLTVLKASVFIGALLWMSIAAGNFVDNQIQRVDELTPSLRVLLGKVVRIALIFLALLVAMQSLNIDLTALTILSGAVGVGIGFGLQKVVSNFISGIIILLDQSIKPGDTITVGETFGWIRELRARFVSVITRDGREYLIPNEDFITTQVINWSFSDRYVRLDVPFGVAYDSDPHEVTKLAIEAAASVGRVDASSRRPVCWMTEFGESSINFLLRFWIEDPQQGLTNIRGKVLLALWDSFKEHGITIPFPQREVTIKSTTRETPAGD
jgi:small-conductance mechanosensitive channel